ncbi:MAG: TlpA family protein disulfide reductase [Acidimicrobiia bacterium]
MRADSRKRGGLLLGSLVVVIAIAAAISALEAGDDSSTTPTTSGPATVGRQAPKGGQAAPGFDLARLVGHGWVRLAQYRGRPVIVNFWASYCQPCEEEFPRLRDLVTRHRGDDLAVIGITYRDIDSDARSFARSHHANWILAKGGDGDPVAKAYGIRAIPQLFFVDRHGVLRKRIFGAPSSGQIDQAVALITPR